MFRMVKPEFTFFLGSFDDVADKASLEEARSELLRLGGQAPAEAVLKPAVLARPEPKGG